MPFSYTFTRAVFFLGTNIALPTSLLVPLNQLFGGDFYDYRRHWRRG